MDPYTALTTPDLFEILTPYGLEPFDSFSVLSGGIENTNYQVTLKEENYVISLFEQKTWEEVLALSQLLQYLENNRFETSKIVSAKNGIPITLWRQKPVMIKRFISGGIKSYLTLPLIELAGFQVGKLHRIPPPNYLPNDLNFGKEHFDLLNDYAPKDPFGTWLTNIVSELVPHLSDELPRAFIHSDLFCDNVLISPDEQKVTLMDFEEAAYYYRIFDVGMAIIGLCSEEGRLNADKVQGFLRGYSKQVTLTTIEQKGLGAFTAYAGASMSFWRHKNFNFIHPELNLNDHYKALQSLANDARNQPYDFFKLKLT